MSRNQHRDRTSNSRTRTERGRVRAKTSGAPGPYRGLRLPEPDGLLWKPFLAPHHFDDVDAATLACEGEGVPDFVGVRYFGLDCAGWRLDRRPGDNSASL